MAKMSHREQNMERWVGVRPGHNGEQIAAYYGVTDATTAVYTVPDGKTLFLVTALAAFDNWSAAARSGSAVLYTDAAAAVWFLAGWRFVANGNDQVPIHFNPPMEIPEKYYFTLISSGANSSSRLSLFGWLEDA